MVGNLWRETDGGVTNSICYNSEQSLRVTYFESFSVFRTYIEFIFLRIPHHPNTWWLDSMQIWWEMGVWYWNSNHFSVDLINTDCCKNKYLFACRSSHFGRCFRGMSFPKNINAYCTCKCLQKCLNTTIYMHWCLLISKNTQRQVRIRINKRAHANTEYHVQHNNISICCFHRM